VELGRLAGWRPLPLSVREARRSAPALRATLRPGPPDVEEPAGAGRPRLTATGVAVRYGRTVAVRDVDLRLGPGQVVAMMGRNGSGKTSLMWALQGTGKRDGGRVEVDGVDPAGVPAAQARGLVGLVPQTAADLLYLETVEEECASAGLACRALLDRLAPGIDGATHPRDLSEGQRLALVLAIVLAASPPVVMLDEPTRGLDYAGKNALAGVLRMLSADGCAVLLATHDVEFVAEVADEVVILAGGEVVSCGPTRTVLAESPAFAPQVSKILGPDWLTVDQVRAALP
jgi:energy-coupling factor transport system ATP-binding protein